LKVNSVDLSNCEIPFYNNVAVHRALKMCANNLFCSMNLQNVIGVKLKMELLVVREKHIFLPLMVGYTVSSFFAKKELTNSTLIFAYYQ
jgi:hypothetical protein